MPLGSLQRSGPAGTQVVDGRGQHGGLDVEIVDGRFEGNLALEVFAGSPDCADDGFLWVF